MKKSKPIIILLVLAVAAGIGLAAWRIDSADRIAPGKVEGENRPKAPAHTGLASVKRVTDWYEAVGTVRPRTESRIGAQVTAQVREVAVNPGDRVEIGQLLVRLDDRQLRSRQDQARQGLQAAIAREKGARQAIASAEAAFRQAEAAFKRAQDYYKDQAATLQDLERAESAYLQAEAGLKSTREAKIGTRADIRQAEQVVEEATIALGYARSLAPAAGEVLKRLVEPGDMAMPGRDLIILRTSGALRLEAYVREGLIRNVRQGTTLTVALKTLGRTVEAVVEEIIPYADPGTRTFLVKVTLPDLEGLYPGMFGALLLPLDARPVVMIPGEAVRRIGQLELVRVKEGDVWRSVYIKTGRRLDPGVEVLSGLSGNETIGWED